MGKKKETEKAGYNARQIFNTGDAFWLAAYRCDEPRCLDAGWIQRLIVPVIVNLAFSCELFMKCILQNRDILMKKAGHNLEELFLKIPDDITKKIIDEAGLKQIGCQIKTISNAFEEWRYIYEVEIHSIDLVFLFWFASKLRCAAADEIGVEL